LVKTISKLRTKMDNKSLDGKQRKNIHIGDEVEIVQKHHQRTGELTDGFVKRILTSGREGKAPDHLPLLKELIDYAGDRILILPGAGIRSDNLADVHEFLQGKEYHGTKIV